MKVFICLVFIAVLVSAADPVRKACGESNYWDPVKAACTSCESGCNMCLLVKGAHSCTQCSSTGNFLQWTDGVGKCVKCVDNCRRCKGPLDADCLELTTSNQKLDGKTTGPRKLIGCTQSNCHFCNETEKCSSCMPGYKITATGSCESIANSGCAEGDTTTCTKCLKGYYLNAGKCTYCSNSVTSCDHCTGDKKCVNCVSGFYPKDAATCTVCPASCARCPDGKCIACNSGSFLKEDGTCATLTCEANCQICQTDKICLQCKSSTTDGKPILKKADGTCVTVSVGCIEANGADDCKTCAPGFALKTGEKACTKCTDSYCADCSADTTKCTKCGPTAVLIDGVCKSLTSCYTGQGLDDKGTCVNSDIENCQYANLKDKTCPFPSKQYFWDNSTSKLAQCQPGCRTCNNNGTYLSCTETFTESSYYSTPGGTIWLIAPNTTAKQDDVGYLCPPGCAFCTSWLGMTVCNKCQPGFIRVTSLVNGQNMCREVTANCTVWASSGSDECFVEQAISPYVRGTPQTIGASALMFSFIALLLAKLMIFA